MEIRRKTRSWIKKQPKAGTGKVAFVIANRETQHKICYTLYANFDDFELQVIANSWSYCFSVSYRNNNTIYTVHSLLSCRMVLDRQVTEYLDHRLQLNSWVVDLNLFTGRAMKTLWTSMRVLDVCRLIIAIGLLCANSDHAEAHHRHHHLARRVVGIST